jgi:hypothetical protein
MGVAAWAQEEPCLRDGSHGYRWLPGAARLPYRVGNRATWQGKHCDSIGHSKYSHPSRIVVTVVAESISRQNQETRAAIIITTCDTRPFLHILAINGNRRPAETTCLAQGKVGALAKALDGHLPYTKGDHYRTRALQLLLDGGKDSGQKLTDVSYWSAARPCNPSQTVATIRARSTHRTSH